MSPAARSYDGAAAAWAPIVGRFRVHLVDAVGSRTVGVVGRRVLDRVGGGQRPAARGRDGVAVPLRDPRRRRRRAHRRPRQPQRHHRGRGAGGGGVPAQRQPAAAGAAGAAVRARRRRQPAAAVRAHAFGSLVGTSVPMRGVLRADGARGGAATRPCCSRARRAPARGRRPRRSTSASARARRAVRGRRLRRHPREPAGERAVRPREGRLHRRAGAPRAAPSRRPTAAPSSSTRSASCRWSCSPSCCACSRTARCGASGTNAYRPVDVRVIAATNRDLRGEVNAGRFRADLFFRLAVLRIVLPPLRQRPEDLPLLVRKLLRGLGADRARAWPAAARRRSSRACRARRGRATSASCATTSSAAWCSRRRAARRR